MKRRLNLFRIVLLCFIFISSSVNAVYLYQNQLDKYKTKTLETAYQIENSKNQEKIEKQVDVTVYQNAVDSLRSEFNNTEVIGSLKINGTGIDTTLVQSTDNSFYLDHSVNKEENRLGSVFMDYRNKIDDKIKIFYGHNSRTLKPVFHELENFLNESFVNEHSYIQILDETGLYNYKIFSVMVIPNNTTTHMQIDFSNNNEYENHLKWLKDSSKFVLDVDVSPKDDIVILQTCYYEPANSFILVVAKKIK